MVKFKQVFFLSQNVHLQILTITQQIFSSWKRIMFLFTISVLDITLSIIPRFCLILEAFSTDLIIQDFKLTLIFFLGPHCWKYLCLCLLAIIIHQFQSFFIHKLKNRVRFFIFFSSNGIVVVIIYYVYALNVQFRHAFAYFHCLQKFCHKICKCKVFLLYEY